MKKTCLSFPNAIRWLAIVSAAVLLGAGCSFAPKYTKPTVPTPTAFKEPGGEQTSWKVAEPKDDAIRSNWWEIFEQPELNALEVQVNVTNNQQLAEALDNFLAARAIMKQTRAGLFPTVSAQPTASYSKQFVANFNNSTASSGSGTGGTTGNTTIRNNQPITAYSLPLDASWEVDLWGSIRNSVKANSLEAQATLGDLESMRLSLQGDVASDYFQLRQLDSQKKLLDDTVRAYGDSLKLTQVLHQTGIASDQDVAQAQTQLSTTLAQDTDLGIQRAQLEHAIATLLGKPASDFSLTNTPLNAHPVPIPFGVPSQLLERRPDVAAAERRVAEANAEIGVARAAYFPTVSLTGDVGFQGEMIGSLSSGPGLIWSVGATAAETIFDAGRRRAVSEQAWAVYNGKVAVYRQTVLTAFQSVEDNLATLRLLTTEVKQEQDAVNAAQHYLDLARDRYKLGIDSYLNVITAQATLLGNQRTELNLQVEQMTASVQLIEALGGSWDGSLTATSVKR